jgi:coniferyl-aldehyde dehydrogenase
MNEAVELMTPSPEQTKTQDSSEIAEMLTAAFRKQRKSYFTDPVPDVGQRKQDLLALKRLLSENVDEILDAISEDYGNRSRHESLFAEVIAVTDGINDTIKKLKKWTRPQRRHVDISLYPGARNRVIPQPLGVVGLIIPCSIALSRVLMRLSPKYLPEEKLMWLEETGGVGIQFSQVPFDLLMFTGSGQTGRAVMASAAKNLTPVVLELGGKSPAIIDPEFPLEKAVERILFVKQFNAGQICTNVDYVFVHESQRQAWHLRELDANAAGLLEPHQFFLWQVLGRKAHQHS